MVDPSRLSNNYILSIGIKKETIDISDLTSISDSIEYKEQRNVYTYFAERTGKVTFTLEGMQK